MEERYDATKVSPDRVIDIFKKKFDKKLYYSIEQILIEDIKPTSLYVQNDRLRYAHLTAMNLIKQGLKLYEPHIKYNGKSHRIVPPPIIEERGKRFVLCDGTHRIITAKELKIKEVIVLVVRDTYLPLAGDITDWDHIVRTDNRYRSCENFVNYCCEGMTGYSKFCNSSIMEVER